MDLQKKLVFHSERSARRSIKQKTAATPLRAFVGENLTTEEIVSPAPDFSSVYASPRFFISTPGLSKSILVEEAVVAVETVSPDPYRDFRKSMEEMVAARGMHDVEANWGGLQELLFRYLFLNPESNHKFITGAFADVLFSLVDGAQPPL